MEIPFWSAFQNLLPAWLFVLLAVLMSLAAGALKVRQRQF